MRNHDQLTTGWQVFLYNVRVDEKAGLLYFGVGIFDEGMQQKKLTLHDPEDKDTIYEVTLPDIYLNSLQSIVHLRKSIPFTRKTIHG